ncbi:MAG: RAMP superfamily CRISPR-associated protein, partial [Chloroflexus sp.]
MKREFHAYFDLALQDSATQGSAVQWLSEEHKELPPRWSALAALTDPSARLEVLAQAMVTGQQEYARSGSRQQIGGYAYWVRHAATRFLNRQLQDMRTLGLQPISPDLRCFPALSFAIRLPFQLQTPYLSKDDRLFHILDNPVRKEWLFHVPMVAASSWKGALRAALWQLGYKEDHDVTIRLLGNPRESEEQQAGRLHFFPTFFDQIGLEV